MSRPPDAGPEPAARTPRALVVFLVAVVVLAGAGFVFKLIEFAATLDEDAAVSFALMPVVTYLTVAAGFFCLLLWALFGGHFKDMEAAKYELMRTEAELERHDAGTAAGRSRR